ncbi:MULTISPECIES: SDR family oxidoreductase [unclassified Streptomyces]|uniref:SDR family NAD(P)-dependent oxidoreductase n=1 Tax=unclassified Streptomyces TaxID=2593676 RepID=UPI002E1671ED|nr:SDR family oxidoreductase [Streptomyces sp. NBC_01197]WSS52503.1 SDR family oxidoreductase [Streptomyces sp. NBC_01180]
MSSLNRSALDGRAALVTGGSRGIGAAVALRLARDGADVAITFERNETAAKEVVAGIQEAGRRGLALRTDAATAVARTVEEFGGLDILVNNAGVGVLAPVGDLTVADLDRTLAVNVREVFLGSQAAAAVLRPGGRIISTGTALTRYAGGPGASLYGMSKAALTGLTRSLARELGERGITVNVIQPGPVDTEMNPADGPYAGPQRAATALGRFGTADEVASLVAYLAGEEAGYVTGAELLVDGGHAA